MFKKLFAKKINKENEEISFPTDQVTLKALCAYKESLVMAEEIDFDELVFTQMAIHEVWAKMPVNA